MAKMIPSLLACRNWRLAASIAVGSGRRPMQLLLSSQDGLTSSKQFADEFDSEVEADLMSKWQSSPVEGWTLRREAELLVHHQKIFLPDFLLEHSCGKKISSRDRRLLDPRIYRSQAKDVASVRP